ncbi:MAG TPA: OsmC family protein [Blastocatellia bacterium]|nr:OsmC family protein [Blastocatellia bacterium]
MTDTSQSETRTAHLRYAGAEAFVGESQSGHAIVTGFAHDNATSATPMELILIALGGCSGADVVTVLAKKRQKFTSYEIVVTAERRAEHPRIYTSIEVLHRVRGRGVDPKAVNHAVELSETKYCSVSAMLSHAAVITSKVEVLEDEP